MEIKTLIQLIEEFIANETGESIKLNDKSKLFGGDGPLDSMSLVSLIVEIEEFVEDNLQQAIILADEKAMSRRTSPFSRVDSLHEYINEKIQENV